MHGVEKLRAVTYGSISSNAVPATGNVSQHASSTTGPDRALRPGQQRTASIHAANSVAHTLARWSISSTTGSARPLRRTIPATAGANSDSRIGSSTNSLPWG